MVQPSTTGKSYEFKRVNLIVKESEEIEKATAEEINLDEPDNAGEIIDLHEKDSEESSAEDEV